MNSNISSYSGKSNPLATPLVVASSSSPNILLRIVYFVFIGWWLGLVISTLAWFLNLTIVGLPFGLWMLNRLPAIITLRSQEQAWHIQEGILKKGKSQPSFIVRTIYFLLIGWWFSAVWLLVAYAALVTILLIPLAFWMYERTGAVTTLYRS